MSWRPKTDGRPTSHSDQLIDARAGVTASTPRTRQPIPHVRTVLPGHERGRRTARRVPSGPLPTADLVADRAGEAGERPCWTSSLPVRNVDATSMIGSLLARMHLFCDHQAHYSPSPRWSRLRDRRIQALPIGTPVDDLGANLRAHTTSSRSIPVKPHANLNARQHSAPHRYARMLDATYSALESVTHANPVISGMSSIYAVAG